MGAISHSRLIGSNANAVFGAQHVYDYVLLATFHRFSNFKANLLNLLNYGPCQYV